MKKKPMHMTSSASSSATGRLGSSVPSSVSRSTPSRTSGNRCRNVVHSSTPPPKFRMSRSTALAALRARRLMPSRSNTHTGVLPTTNDDTPKNAMANIFASTGSSASKSIVVPCAPLGSDTSDDGFRLCSL